MPDFHRLTTLGAATITIASLLATPALVAAYADPAIYVEDAPVTHNQTVKFSIPMTTSFTEARVSNSNATSSGVLIGTAYIYQSDWWWAEPPSTSIHKKFDWTLPDGADGPRTMYAQVKFWDGTWSGVSSLELILDRSGATSLYVDSNGPDEYQFPVQPGSDLHTRSTNPPTPIVATAGVAPMGNRITVKDGLWTVSLIYEGTIAAGTFAVDGPGDGDCAEGCVDVTYNGGPYNSPTCHATGGVFDIAEITYESGDIRTLTADFNVDCNRKAIGGSIRYGSDAPTYALDQTWDEWLYGQLLLGTTATTRTLTITNFGDVDNQLGEATFSGPGAGDWSLVSDTCSNQLLAVDDTCALVVQPTPTVRRWRRAFLTMPDQTTRGQREAVLEVEPVEQSVIEISAPVVPDEPGPARIDVTVAPPSDWRCEPDLTVDGQNVRMVSSGELTDPPRAVYSTLYTFELGNGRHVATAEYDECDWLLASGPVSITVTVGEDSVPPTGSISINDGAAFTNSNAVYVRPNAHDNESEVAQIALSLDQQDWVEYWIDDAVWFGLPLTPGTYTLYGKYADSFGNWSTVSSDSIVFDDSPPNVDPPGQELVAGSAITKGKVLVRVPLSAADTLSGISTIDLNQRTDNGSWRNIPVAGQGVIALGQESVDRVLAPGHAYTFRARADDNATNTCDWAVGPRLSLRKYQEGSGAIRYTGKWARKAASSFWGGAARASVKSGATASLTFTGRSFGWVTTYGPDRGKAEIYVNGVLTATVDLYSPTVINKRVVWAGNWATSATRTVTIKVLATASRPKVEIDALITAQ